MIYFGEDYNKIDRDVFVDGEDVYERIVCEDGEPCFVKLILSETEINKKISEELQKCEEVTSGFLPQSIREVADCMRIIVNLNIQALVVLESSLILSGAAPNEEKQNEIQEKAFKFMNEIDAITHTYASLKPLWFHGKMGRLEYYGENPYNYEPELFETPGAVSKLQNGEDVETVNKYGFHTKYSAKTDYIKLSIRSMMHGTEQFSVRELCNLGATGAGCNPKKCDELEKKYQDKFASETRTKK